MVWLKNWKKKIKRERQLMKAVEAAEWQKAANQLKNRGHLFDAAIHLLEEEAEQIIEKAFFEKE